MRLETKKLGCIFKRQYSIGPYIVDFYCSQKRLVIELDGKQHEATKDYDQYRTNYFNGLNIKVVRYLNKDIFEDINKIVKNIIPLLK
jgi:very-short-patch-repair endonuclease